MVQARRRADVLEKPSRAHVAGAPSAQDTTGPEGEPRQIASRPARTSRNNDAPGRLNAAPPSADNLGLQTTLVSSICARALLAAVSLQQRLCSPGIYGRVTLHPFFSTILFFFFFFRRRHAVAAQLSRCTRGNRRGREISVPAVCPGFSTGIATIMPGCSDSYFNEFPHVLLMDIDILLAFSAFSRLSTGGGTQRFFFAEF